MFDAYHYDVQLCPIVHAWIKFCSLEIIWQFFIVCSITRRPAKPINAFGSLKFISPTDAKLADTPPVVGCVKYDIYNSPASE